ncbi:DUF742 domain-containing protein [Streptomyces varsoviensis]|uniref:DUF742 domain-containing protein n=1 Tax=Streptomyces varsoviensis TaxID=67373 RepID=A0ABR5IY29_9ACTN|nr:DUF742 domain-containing protein [Streptomyces varsoviensis]KOG86067.1 hypothetical protein ADK38_33115 [Streptomyces varsoviensis]
MSEAGQCWEPGSPERLFALSEDGGPARYKGPLDLVTLIVTRSVPDSGLQPEQAAVLRMCDYPLSVAEISAYLSLPVSALLVLLNDLVAQEHVEARPPVPAAALPDIQLLEAVMHGLQNL